MEMCNIMVSKSFQKESVRFVLNNVPSPIMQDGYELFPAGYISFPSFWDYKKIKNINKIISRFLERRREKYDDDDKVLKCLELIESLIEGCDVMSLVTNDEYSFDEAFHAIFEFIKKVGYDYKYNKLYDVGNKILFVNESNMAKEKYINIVEKLYKKKIWPFEG